MVLISGRRVLMSVGRGSEEGRGTVPEVRRGEKSSVVDGGPRRFGEVKAGGAAVLEVLAEALLVLVETVLVTGWVKGSAEVLGG